MMPEVSASEEVGGNLLLAYRDLVATEASLAESLAPRGLRVGVSVIDQWATLHDYLNLYARGLSPASIVVFGGGPDAGSRQTGIPFTGAKAAREHLGVQAEGDAASPAERAFWAAVEDAWVAVDRPPLEALFANVHLAQARPFDFEPVPEVRDASARHALRVLAEIRPQVTVLVGSEAVHVLARATQDPRVLDMAAIPEADWPARWPPGSRLLDHPYLDVPIERPFRTRVVPVPSLDGPLGKAGTASLAHLFAHAWAA